MRVLIEGRCVWYMCLVSFSVIRNFTYSTMFCTFNDNVCVCIQHHICHVLYIQENTYFKHLEDDYWNKLREKKSASCWSLLRKFSASVKVFLLQTTISIIHQAINHYSHQEHVTSNVCSKVQVCRPEACYVYPQFAHSSFRFARNPDKVGHLSSTFFIHIIQICVTRRWNSLTCKANCTSFFFIRFMSACYMCWLCGPSSGINP